MDHIPKINVKSKTQLATQLPILAGETGFKPIVAKKPKNQEVFPIPAPAIEVGGKSHTGMGAISIANPLELDFSKLIAALGPALLPAAVEAAEGYLELVTRPAVRLGVNLKLRRQYAKKALQLASDFSPGLLEPQHEARRQMVIGQSLRVLRRYRMATKSFRQASKYRPLRVEALLAMGWCQKRSGNVDQAVVSLNRALAIVPDDGRLHYNLACYLACLGQHRAAVYELAWALELEPKLQTRAVAEADFDTLRLFPAFVALTQPRIII